MPRIRTIKPEFWDSPGTAKASLRARLFFIALWGWADDWGIGTANPKHLIGYAFPNDDEVSSTDFPRLAAEVADSFDVAWYEVDGRPYFCIPSWDDHQKNERRSAKRNPGPDQGVSMYAELRGSSVRTDGKNPLGTGEQGNRGTGEQTLLSIAMDDSDEAASEKAMTADDHFAEFWKSYPRKTQRADARKAYTRALKKASPETILAGVKDYKFKPDRDFQPQAERWLNGERWNDVEVEGAWDDSKLPAPGDSWNDGQLAMVLGADDWEPGKAPAGQDQQRYEFDARRLHRAQRVTAALEATGRRTA